MNGLSSSDTTYRPQGLTDAKASSSPSSSRATSDLAKLQADIACLQELIALVQAHSKPNSAVLQTYQTMLCRREAALDLLLHAKTKRLPL